MYDCRGQALTPIDTEIVVVVFALAGTAAARAGPAADGAGSPSWSW